MKKTTIHTTYENLLQLLGSKCSEQLDSLLYGTELEQRIHDNPVFLLSVRRELQEQLHGIKSLVDLAKSLKVTKHQLTLFVRTNGHHYGLGLCKNKSKVNCVELCGPKP